MSVAPAIAPVAVGKRRKRWGPPKGRPGRQRLRRSQTKAELKRQFAALWMKAHFHLDVVDRSACVPDKLEHLRRATAWLERCLEMKPGTWALRQQLRLCLETREELERTGRADVQVPRATERTQ